MDGRQIGLASEQSIYAIRPLVVIDIHEQVAEDEGYHLQVEDIKAWEAEHGRIPEGSVVMVRSDWHKKWADSQRFNQKPFPGVGLAALKFLHLERKILFHGHEPLDTDTTPDLEGEYWLMHNHFAQAEGVANLDQVPASGALIMIGFAKPKGGTGGYARYIAVAPDSWPHGVSVAEVPGAPLPVSTASVATGRERRYAPHCPMTQWDAGSRRRGR